MKYYLNDKKVSKKTLAETIGAETMASRISEAKTRWAADPMTQMSWMVDIDTMMSIENDLQ